MFYILLFCLFILLFIFGMTILRTGLFNVSGHSLQNWLEKWTDAHWKGLLIGTFITGVLQSSSAVMVMTIGLISAGMLTFRQSIGIILGTNIGTTFTTEFITFQIDSILIPFAIVGAILICFSHIRMKSIGLILLGISSVFTAMSGFEFLASPLAELSFIKGSIADLNTSKLFSVVTGIILTAVIQSSSATTGIIMGFLTTNVLNISAGIGVMLGSNIGTCVTSLFASVGGGRESKLCAYAHVWLNVVGVLLFIPLIGFLSQIAPILAHEPDVQLAHISLVFNVISSLIVLPFATQFGQFILRIHGGNKAY